VVVDCVAVDQLRAGRPVVADAVNDVTPARVETRRPWQPFPEPNVIIDNLGDPNVHAAAVIDWSAHAGAGSSPR